MRKACGSLPSAPFRNFRRVGIRTNAFEYIIARRLAALQAKENNVPYKKLVISVGFLLGFGLQPLLADDVNPSVFSTEIRNPLGKVDYDLNGELGNVNLDGVLTISNSTHAKIHLPDSFAGTQAESISAQAGVSFDAKLQSGESVNLFTASIQAHSDLPDILDNLFAKCRTPVSHSKASLVFQGILLKGIPELLKTRYRGDGKQKYITTSNADDSYLEMGQEYTATLGKTDDLKAFCDQIKAIRTLKFHFDAKTFVLLELKASQGLTAYRQQFSAYQAALEEHRAQIAEYQKAAQASLQQWQGIESKLVPLATIAHQNTKNAAFAEVINVISDAETSLKSLIAVLNTKDIDKQIDAQTRLQLISNVSNLTSERDRFDKAITTLSSVLNFDPKSAAQLVKTILNNPIPALMVKCGPDFVWTVRFPIWEYSASGSSNGGSYTVGAGASGDVAASIKNISCGASINPSPGFDAIARADVEAGSHGYFGAHAEGDLKQNYVTLKIDGENTPITKGHFPSDKEKAFIAKLNDAEAARINRSIVNPVKAKLSGLADSFTKEALKATTDQCSLASAVLGGSNTLTDACIWSQKAAQSVPACPPLPNCDDLCGKIPGTGKRICKEPEHGVCEASVSQKQKQCNALRQPIIDFNAHVSRAISDAGRDLANVQNAIHKKILDSFDFEAMTNQLTKSAIRGENDLQKFDEKVVGPISDLARQLSIGFEVWGSSRIAFDSKITVVEFYPNINTNVKFACDKNRQLSLETATTVGGYKDGKLGGFSALGYKFEFEVFAKVGDKKVFDTSKTPLDGSVPEFASLPISVSQFRPFNPIRIDLGRSCD
jgi:hypothetical protein